jgi:hygromycin-B 7''-O-kinase
VPGFNVTYPTFICGDVAVKLFGYLPAWRPGYAAERAALELVATDPEIAAPRLLGAGWLYEGFASSWPYLITTRMPGVASWRVELSPEETRSLAAELGRQIRRVHSLAPAGVATHEEWRGVGVTEAATRSSLPPHLVAQVDGYVARLGSFDRVFINADVVANHVYVEDGRFIGIIDWGDALVADRHVEIIQIYRDTFACDRRLLRAFLDAYGWSIDDGFPHKALGHALYRQAIGLTQHPTIDVFEPIAERFPLEDIATLDELAIELFAV